MMLRYSTVVLGWMALVAVPAAAQRATAAATPTGFKTLFTVDSGRIPNIPAISPDGKWMVFTQAGDGSNSSVWVAAVANPKAFRIISGDYADSWPTFSPTGDRVFFTSNRPNRDSRSTAKFVMSIPIDKATGRPSGPVQQVTTDSVGYLPPLGVSPDGKWLAYNASGTPTLVRLVSAVGGNARTLATKFTGSTPLTFSADGRNVVFSDSLGTLIREVSIAGGPVATLYRAAKGKVLLPTAYRDDRYIVVDMSVGGAELRDRSGGNLGVVPTPPAGNLFCGSTYGARSDGRGLIGVTNRGCEGLKRVTLATGVTEDVVVPNSGYLTGMTVDGSIWSCLDKMDTRYAT